MKANSENISPYQPLMFALKYISLKRLSYSAELQKKKEKNPTKAINL